MAGQVRTIVTAGWAAEVHLQAFQAEEVILIGKACKKTAASS